MKNLGWLGEGGADRHTHEHDKSNSEYSKLAKYWSRNNEDSTNQL